ncbi:hypothetical protein [Streptomyces sp. NPDC004135]
MRRELRGGECFGVMPTPVRIKELVDEVVAVFDEPVEVEYLTVRPNYYVRSANLDDLISETQPPVRALKNLAVHIKCTGTERAEAHIVFGESPSRWRRRWHLFPYRTGAVTHWSLEHPDAGKANRIAREVRHGLDGMRSRVWAFKSGISKWHVVNSVPLVLVGCLFIAIADPTKLSDWKYISAGVIAIAWRWCILAFDYQLRIEVGPPPIQNWWTSWNPNSATVAKATVLATALAVPALILSLVQVFQG